MLIKRLLGIGNKPGPTELLIRAAVLLIVKEIRRTEAKIMGTLDDVIAKVAEQSSVVASAAELIDGLQAKLEAALKSGLDPAKVQGIVDTLEADKNKLLEAFKENTVVEDDPEEVVPPAPVEEPAPAPVEEPVAEAPAEEPKPIEYDEWGNPKE